MADSIQSLWTMNIILGKKIKPKLCGSYIMVKMFDSIIVNITQWFGSFPNRHFHCQFVSSYFRSIEAF